MKELILILLQIPIIIIFFSYPFNLVTTKSFFSIKNVCIYDTFITNVIINSSVLLILSFFSLNYKYFFYLIFFLNLTLIIRNIKIYKNFFLKDSNFKIFIFFIVCFLSISVLISFDPRLTWDGIAHWYYKALNYHQGGSYENIKNLPFAYYPHLGPYIWSFFWSINPINFEYLGRFFYIFIFLLPFFSAIERLKNNLSTNIKILILLILISITLDKFLLGGYQEYLIFFLFYSFAFYFNNNSKNNNFPIISMIFLSSFLMIWTKQEGLFYHLILSLLFILFFSSSTKAKFFYTISVLLSIYLMIQIKNYFHGDFHFNEPMVHEGLLRFLNLKILINSLSLITFEIIKAAIKYPLWILILLFIFIDQMNNKKLINQYNIFAIFFIGFIYLVYLQTSMDMKQLMPLTLDRLLFQGCGFFLIYVIQKLNYYINNI